MARLAKLKQPPKPKRKPKRRGPRPQRRFK